MKLRQAFISIMGIVAEEFATNMDARNWLESLRWETQDAHLIEWAGKVVYAIEPAKSVWRVATAICSDADRFNSDVGEAIARHNLSVGKYINFYRNPGETVEDFALQSLNLDVY